MTTSNEERLAAVETTVEHLQARSAAIEAKLDSINNRVLAILLSITGSLFAGVAALILRELGA